MPRMTNAQRKAFANARFKARTKKAGTAHKRKKAVKTVTDFLTGKGGTRAKAVSAAKSVAPKKTASKFGKAKAAKKLSSRKPASVKLAAARERNRRAQAVNARRRARRKK